MQNPLPSTMKAMLLTGHGGLDKMIYREDVPVPRPAANEVLIKVGACGMNNTDINTRTGWYSKSVTASTNSTITENVDSNPAEEDSTWGGKGLQFPRIQGADICGTIVKVGENIDPSRIGQRVLVDPWNRDPDYPNDRKKAGYFGSERDGGYAEYTVAPDVNALAINSDLSDAKLATFPCSYSTAEYMLTRARLEKNQRIVIPGASGGVGSALIQLAKRRCAFVVAIAGKTKCEAVRGVGADVVLARDLPDLESALRVALPGSEADVVADIVGGQGFAMMLNLLCRGGRYVTSGAIAGPIVSLDLRTLYLHDLSLLGATVMPASIFPKVIGYIERGEIHPLLARTFSLTQLHQAQEAFLAKEHVGNFVIIPDEVDP